jgi:thiamine-monophosphate kinase
VRVSDIGERALIQRITARLAMPGWVVVGPGDDAAVVEPERGSLEVLTIDTLVEGVHFDRRFCPPDAIGHKALAVNLSDLAAMGASPRAALLSLALPSALPVADVDGMLDGLLALAARHKVALIGGNIAGASTEDGLVVTIAAAGSVGRRRVLTRGGARPGDIVYVTGALGGGLVGLRMLQSGGDGDIAQRYLRPEPRVRIGTLLGRNRAATACMDLSDGLADGVRQVSEASGVGMTIDAAALPLAPGVREWHERHGADVLQSALSGGDDYELLFTTRASLRGRLRGVERLAGDLPITRIGVVTKDRRVIVRTESGEHDVVGGFEHFR